MHLDNHSGVQSDNPIYVSHVVGEKKRKCCCCENENENGNENGEKKKIKKNTHNNPTDCTQSAHVSPYILSNRAYIIQRADCRHLTCPFYLRDYSKHFHYRNTVFAYFDQVRLDRRYKGGPC